MSVRAVPTPLPNRTSGRTVGLVAALAVALVGVAQGQTPQPPAGPSAADALDAYRLTVDHPASKEVRPSARAINSPSKIFQVSGTKISQPMSLSPPCWCWL